LYADAKDTATLITQIFAPSSNQNNNTQQGGRGGFPGGGGPGGFMRAAMAQMAASSNTRANAGAHVVAVADDRSNSVVISAPPDLMPTIEDMVKEIDRQVSDETEVRVFRLANADPTELADQLSQLFPDETSSSNNNNQNVPFFFRRFGGGGAQTGAGATSDRTRKLGKVMAVADPRTESLIVSASRTMMPQIADMIAELDANKGKKEVVGFYELQNADPQDIQQNLQDLFNRSTVRMNNNNNNRNSLLGQNNPLTIRETTGNQQPTIGSTLSRSALGSSAGGGGGGRLP
ncbi:MAG: secretin N-terminal domain-containing protein, partial [Limisphaerales bacterium]